MLRSLVLCVVVVCAVAACIPPGPGSREYKPVSKWEEDAFKKADRGVFPNDVRADFGKYDSLRAAWPGIILNAEVRPTDSAIALDLLVEHHYYDWIEDFSIQQEKIFLSPRGEGLFRTTWWLKLDADTAELARTDGDMVIVYGIPTALEDSVVVLKAYYVRLIDKQWFATDIMDYGRPGEPVTVLRVP